MMVDHGSKLVIGGHETNSRGYGFENFLLRVSGYTFLQNPQSLQSETFGTVNLIVFARDAAQMRQVAA